MKNFYTRLHVIALLSLLFSFNLISGQNNPPTAVSLPLTYMNGFYTMPLQLIDPDTDKVIFRANVALDTGSSNLLLLGANCPNCHYRFNKIDKDSIGWQPKTPNVSQSEDGFYKSFKMSYDEGSVYADWWAAKVQIGTTPLELISFNKAFGVVYDDPEPVADELPNILGLGYASNMTKSPNEETNSYIHSFLDLYFDSFSGEAIFSFGMNKNTSPGYDGIIDFGLPVHEPTVYLPITDPDEYVIQPETLTLALDFKLDFTEIKQTIVDSGTSDIVVPMDWFQKIKDQIAWIFRENNVILHGVVREPYRFWANVDETVMKSILAKLNVSLQMAGETFTLDYNTFIKYEKDPRLPGASYIDVRISDGDDDVVILGQAFMKGFYTIFDLSTTPNRIGLYQYNLED